MYTGILLGLPKIVVEKSTVVTSRSTRGRNHILERESELVMLERTNDGPMVSGVILPKSDLVICSRRVVCPGLL